MEYQHILCEPITAFCKSTRPKAVQLSLFGNEKAPATNSDIRVCELFAGVGGFRVGLERASEKYKTVWSNQWEPSTKRQDASTIYCRQFGSAGHSNVDIAAVPSEDIPDHDLLVGGFPCQDYSVATTLKRSGGIEGKKGCSGGRLFESSVKKKASLRLYSWKTLTGSLNRQPRSEGATSPLSSHRSPTLDITWNGA